ncbi:MAG: hypothetical protein DRQ44_05080 [Gammaproteobacteria bacterium]|nr:MAG: hypothetical protein DRQ44_05080 [Gammaproteobacteria bacterium]
MRKSVIGMLFICLAVVSFNTSAALVSTNWKTVGDNLITRDTDSGLEWLDLTETTGLSYNDVSSKFSEGEQFAGWSYASITEVRELLNNAGGSGVYNGAWSAENNGVVIPLLDLWGHTLTYAEEV